MNNTTLTLESKMIAIANTLYLMSDECDDLNQYYFGTSASSLVSAVGAGTDPVTTSDGGSLTKDQMTGGITLIQALQSFFGNSSVSTTPYLQYADKLIHGSATLSIALSQDVENIGARLKALAQNLIQINKDATNAVKLYDSSGLSAIMGSVASETVLFGCNLTKSKFINGIVLLEQLQNLLNNGAVTTADYLSTAVNLAMGG